MSLHKTFHILHFIIFPLKFALKRYKVNFNRRSALRKLANTSRRLITPTILSSYHVSLSSFEHPLSEDLVPTLG